MDKRELEIEECGVSVKKLYEALKEANVEGLYPKALEASSGTIFLVVMPEMSKGNVDSGNNIFIDVEEWGYLNGDASTAVTGEFTFNYGFGHLHIGYGAHNPIEEGIERIVNIVKGLQNKTMYAYGIVTPIGSVISGYKDVPENPEVTFETDLTLQSIIRYYTNNIYKEGMPDYPEKDVFYSIVEKLESAKKKDMLYWVLWNEEAHRCELLGSGEEGNK